MRELLRRRFLNQFFHRVDLKHVLDGSPWTFNNALLLLHHLRVGENPLEVPLFDAIFWVQAHNLPMGYCNDAAAGLLGNFMGKFLEYDSASFTRRWRNYVRMKVSVDIRKPLKRVKKVATKEGKELYVSFKYEKISTFCYLCGQLGHAE
ncbi:uncharacterized protein At4g02000 [Manihot esculenta]|nr:uncharacterized protein At4g02000 [Manihot esculenta]